MACAPACPGYHACRTADAFALAQVYATALPLIDTTISGLPVALIASSKCCCDAGRAMSVRSPPANPSARRGIDSPSNRGERPTKATTTSACAAAAFACSNRTGAGGIQLNATTAPKGELRCAYLTSI